LRVVDETDRYSRQTSHPGRQQAQEAARRVQCPPKAARVLPISMLPRLEDTAHSFFFTTYVPGSHFSYLPIIIRSTALADPVTACIQAVALASFSNEQQNPAIMKSAIKHYSLALSETKLAMTSSGGVTKDSTVICVLLLGLFEALCHSGQQIPRNYTAHNEGALALLELRGPELVQKEIGYLLYLQVSSNIRVSSIVNKKRTPSRLLAFHKRMIPFVDSEDPKVRLFTILDDFAELQAVIAEDNIQHSLETACIASRLDSRCESLMDTIRDSSQFTVHISEREVPFAYGREWHTYPDAHVAQWWNAVRQSRIMLNQIILDQLATAHFIDDPNILRQSLDMQISAVTAIQQAAGEICASVPQFAQEIHQNRSKSNTAALSLVSRLFFSLCTVGDSTVVPEQMRRFAARSLWYFGTTTNFPQAIDAAKMIEENSLDTSW
jgi:Fungal specific transcription factor domain